MKSTRKAAPDQKGVRKPLDQCGAQRVCVRYHDDRQKRKQFKTIKLIKKVWQ